MDSVSLRFFNQHNKLNLTPEDLVDWLKKYLNIIKEAAKENAFIVSLDCHV